MLETLGVEHLTGEVASHEESTPLFDGERQVGRRDLQRIVAPQQTGDRQVARPTTAPPVVTPARYGGYFASPTPSGHPSQ